MPAVDPERTVDIHADSSQADAALTRVGAVLRSTSDRSRPPREVALQFALDSLSLNDTPPGASAIVDRAQAFLAFLDSAA